MFALSLSLALLPVADQKESPDARQVAEKFLALALAGKPEEAAKLGREGQGPSRPEKVREIKKATGVARLALPTVLVSEKKGYALAVSEEVKFPTTKPGEPQSGVIILTLKKNKDGAWRVKDIDARDTKEAAKRVEEAKKKFADAKELPPTKS
jgi:hypothetical protein